VNGPSPPDATNVNTGGGSMITVTSKSVPPMLRWNMTRSGSRPMRASSWM
jgi:hypothetical protein